MQIELFDIEALEPYGNNSRTHTPKQIRALRKSIENFGFVGAVVIRNGTIAKGHATLEAVKAIYDDGGQLFPAPGKKGKPKPKPFPKGKIPVIDCSDWNEQQFKAFVIADNRIAEQAGWDRAFLAEELPTIDDIDLTDLLADIEISELVEVHNLGARYDFSAQARSGESAEKETESESEPVATETENVLKYPVTFALDAEEWVAWLAIKKATKSITHKAIFLKGMEAHNGS
jgi:hypothetical protein